MRLCLLSTQPNEPPPGLLLLALFASFRALHLDSHLTKTNKANPNPSIAQHPGRGLALGRQPPPRSRAPQPLTPPEALPAPALPASFCVALESPPPRPPAPPQPALPLPFGSSPPGRSTPEGQRAGAGSLRPSAYFSPQLSAPSGPRSPGGEERRGKGRGRRAPHIPSPAACSRLRPPPPLGAGPYTPSRGRGGSCHQALPPSADPDWAGPGLPLEAAIDNALGGEADLPVPTIEAWELERRIFRGGRGVPLYTGR